MTRLKAFGVSEVIVNVHHFADMVVEYLAARQNFGMRIEISREEELLDTGGGLKKAAWFFQEGSSGNDEPFLLHNVDVISTIDLSRMVKSHRSSRALATLAVQDRETSRYLLFDDAGELCGRRAGQGRGGRVGASAIADDSACVFGRACCVATVVGNAVGGWSVFDCDFVFATGGTAGKRFWRFGRMNITGGIWGRWRV